MGRENKSVSSRNVLSFSVSVLKVIFFANAKNDISLTGSDIARQRLAVILYSPRELAKRISLGVSRISPRSNITRRRRI